ncbi:MAG TPA: glycosyl hydrolase, partial [Gemmatimonadaceae bacterium]
MRRVASVLLFACVANLAHAQAEALKWRMIGPFRGGRTKAGTGVPSQPNVFYVGFVNGGVWKTDDYGRVWTPIFDDQPSGSIGAIAVSESNPNIVYVGSGEGIQRPDLTTGDGIYRSDDAGKTWTHLGLRDGQQIPQIIVDPRNPDRIFVAVLGHPYGPNTERGVFRSLDGGKTFDKVLYKDENTGAAEVAFDPSNAQVVYAVMWEARQAPWENGSWTGAGSGLFKSTDGGATWSQIGKGLPAAENGRGGLGRVGISVSASMPSRIYAVVSAPESKMGIYRSDDAGESFTRLNADPRLAGRDGDFDEIKVDPQNADVAYVANVMTWKTTDGGKTFKEFRGAPGGDDYQRFWVNPRDPNILLLTSDQGAVITVNGGKTWSSWYNQPTAQFYHVNADYGFPYKLCGGQQESGSACVSSRSDDGQITFENWTLPGVEEYGYVVPDPLHPGVYFGGRISRTDMRTRDVQAVSPVPARDTAYGRVLRTAPIVFSTVNPQALFYGTNVVWKTLNGGKSWKRISPDLTRKESGIPASVGKYRDDSVTKARHPGVVYAIAPSYVNERWIWAGTDDGLIQVTKNGGVSWQDVTPPALKTTPWAKVSIIDAGHFDSLTAYAAVNTFRLDDLRPHLFATHDGGKSWREINDGIPAGGVTNAIREDPVRRGLLFAGAEQGVYYSMDDGAHWKSLRLNMPATAIRDLIIKDNDV